MTSNLYLQLILDLFLLALFFCFYRYRKRIFGYISASNCKKKLIFTKYLRLIFGNCKIRYNNWFTTLLLPLVFTLTFWFYLSCQMDYSPNVNLPILYKINSILLAPLWEEILFRGIVLGLVIAFFTGMFTKFKWQRGILSKWGINICALFIVAIVFSLFHKFKIDLKYISGLIYGFVYILDKKNLLPAVLAHFFHNFFVVYLQMCPI